MNRRAWKRLADIITIKRNRTYKQGLERATARARARKRARENLVITIPRSLWETAQQRQDDIEDPPRRKRIRLILPQMQVLETLSLTQSHITYHKI
jgi:hypothetical protein